MAETTIASEMTKWLLRQSMGEELVASSIYHIRAIQAEQGGDFETAGLFKHIAKEEDRHYIEFGKRMVELYPGSIYPAEHVVLG